MAEGAVSAFVSKLSQLILEEVSFLSNVRQQLVTLRDELEWMRQFLRDAERKCSKSQLVKVWVTQIQDLAYDAEDVIDVFTLRDESWRSRNWARNLFGGSSSSPNKPTKLHIFGNQIKQFNKRAKRLKKCQSDYDLCISETTEAFDVYPQPEDMEHRLSIPTRQEFAVVGLQAESNLVVNWLNEEAPERKVLSIIGMGGLGKTTLAQMIYSNKDVSDHFDSKAWITTSRVYQVKDLFLSLLKQYKQDGDEDLSGLERMDADGLQVKLYKHLEDLKYLVIIDNVWKVETWDQISLAFPNNNKGSKVILTTRNKQVALHADPSSRNHLELSELNTDDSWELLCKKVFSRSPYTCPPELVELGKEIAARCCGLPLAIVVLGGILMSKERNHDAWSRIRDSATWQLSRDSSKCRKILVSSLTDMPYYLKSCFLYLGLFPEDKVIDARKLILLWAAEGFVEERGMVKMEDVAEECLEELIKRNLIQVKYRMYQGGPVVECQVHNLLRDLSISEARKDRFIEIHSKKHYATSPTMSRRYAIHSSKRGEHALRVPTNAAPKLRSLLIFNRVFQLGLLKSSFWSGENILRVLDLEGVFLTSYRLEVIGNLVLLRYLGLRSTEIQSLPTSIGNLLKLQTLDIRGTQLNKLPRGIWKLKNLRHLFGTESLRLSKLQWGNLEDFGENLLTLHISGALWVHLSDALIKIERLRSLKLYGKVVVRVNSDLRKCFPSSLTEVSLYGTDFDEDIADALGNLPWLKALLLGRGSFKGRLLVRNGGFRQLRFLVLSYLHDLTEWSINGGGISNLRHLRVWKCERLRKLPHGLQNIDTLQKIEFWNMPEAFTDRIKQNGEDWDIVRNVPSIDVHQSLPAEDS